MTHDRMKIPYPPFPEIAGVQFRYCNRIPGHAVTDTGTVWSCRVGGRGRKGNVGPWKKRKESRTVGYPSVRALIDGKIITFCVHRLVLEAFVGPCPKGMECRHLNGNKLDNRVENLRWGTRRENTIDAVNHGTNGFLTNTHPPITTNIVKYIRGHSGLVPQRELADLFCVSQTYISSIIRRVTKNYIGSGAKYRKTLGLLVRGEKSGRAKLTDNDVNMIIKLKGKQTQKATALQFKVSVRHVQRLWSSGLRSPIGGCKTR